MKNNLVQKILIASLLIVLAACGGGGGSDSDNSAPSENVGSAISKNFSLALSDIDVRRVSSGDDLTIDILNITSGELTLTQ